MAYGRGVSLNWTSVLALFALVGLWFLLHLSLTGWAILAAVVWLLVRSPRQARPHESPLDTEERVLKLQLLRTKLALTDPDVVAAARDLARGRITREEYDTAVEIAARRKTS